MSAVTGQLPSDDGATCKYQFNAENKRYFLPISFAQRMRLKDPLDMELKLLLILRSMCSIVMMVTIEESNFGNFISVANTLAIKGRINAAFFSELKLTSGCWCKRKTISR